MLLVATLRGDEEEEDALPELVAGETISGHIGEVAPQHRGGDLLNGGHGGHAGGHQEGLQ